MIFLERSTGGIIAEKRSYGIMIVLKGSMIFLKRSTGGIIAEKRSYGIMIVLKVSMIFLERSASRINVSTRSMTVYDISEKIHWRYNHPEKDHGVVYPLRKSV